MNWGECQRKKGSWRLEEPFASMPGFSQLAYADGGSSVLMVVTGLSEGEFTDFMTVFQLPTWSIHCVPQSQVL